MCTLEIGQAETLGFVGRVRQGGRYKHPLQLLRPYIPFGGRSSDEKYQRPQSRTGERGK